MLPSVTELIVIFSHQLMRRKRESTAARGRGSLPLSPTLGEGRRATSSTGGGWARREHPASVHLKSTEKKNWTKLKHFQPCFILVRVWRRPRWTLGGPCKLSRGVTRIPHFNAGWFHWQHNETTPARLQREAQIFLLKKKKTGKKRQERATQHLYF